MLSKQILSHQQSSLLNQQAQSKQLYNQLHQRRLSADQILFDFKKFSSNMLDNVQSEEFRQKCKNHEKKLGCYFTRQQPWIKYCSKCALNLALCGKRIQKRFSQQELKKKFELQNICYELKYNLKISEQKQRNLNEKVNYLQKNVINNIEGILNLYDKSIQQWSRKRNELSKMYNEQILEYFNTLNEQKIKILNLTNQLKKQIQNIQNNFVIIINQLTIDHFKTSIITYKNNIQQIMHNIKINDIQFMFDTKKIHFQNTYRSIIHKSKEFYHQQIQFLKQQIHQNHIFRTYHHTENHSQSSQRDKSPSIIIPIHNNNIYNCQLDSVITPISINQNFSNMNSRINSGNITNSNSINKQNNQPQQQIKLKLKPLLQSQNSQHIISNSQRTSKTQLRNRTNSKLSQKKDQNNNNNRCYMVGNKSPIQNINSKINNQKKSIFYQKNM